MKKLHSLAFYTLVTPVIALSSTALFAQQEADQDVDLDQKSTQHDKSEKTYDSHTGSQSGQDNQYTDDGAQVESRGYLGSVPANGLQASELIGTKVHTSGDEEVGPVSDLIIDQNGQVVAVIVGVGGFLGMGEKDVAIGWDDVTTSGTADARELRIDVTREELRSAPEFDAQE